MELALLKFELAPQELTAIEDAIRAAGIKAIFVSFTVNPVLAEHVAQDTGALSQPGGDAPPTSR